VTTADPARLEDFTIDELDAVLGPQNACLGHPMVFLDREQSPSALHQKCHRVSSLLSICQFT